MIFGGLAKLNICINRNLDVQHLAHDLPLLVASVATEHDTILSVAIDFIIWPSRAYSYIHRSLVSSGLALVCCENVHFDNYREKTRQAALARTVRQG